MTNLKALREAKNMSQADLAAVLGVARSTIAMWETGQNMPSTKILLSLASALNCTTDDLLKKEAQENVR